MFHTLIRIAKFDQRRNAQGYQWPGERKGCRNCRHRSADATGFDDGGGRTAYDCRLGGFLVVPNGICREYQPAAIAGLPGSPERRA